MAILPGLAAKSMSACSSLCRRALAAGIGAKAIWCRHALLTTHPTGRPTSTVTQGVAWGGQRAASLVVARRAFCTERLRGPCCATSHGVAVTADKRREPGIDLEDCHVLQCNGLPLSKCALRAKLRLGRPLQVASWLVSCRTSQTKGNPESYRAPTARVQPGKSPRAMSYKADRQGAAHHH